MLCAGIALLADFMYALQNHGGTVMIWLPMVQGQLASYQYNVRRQVR